MTDYAALAAEVARPEFAGMSDAEIAAALRADMRQEWRDVPTSVIRRALLIANAPTPSLAADLRVVPAWGLIERNARRAAVTSWASAAASPSSQDQMVSQMAALVTWLDTLQVVETTEPEVRARFQAIFNSLVLNGWLSASTRDAVLALAQRSVSRAEQLGFRDLNANEIAAARRRGG